ncbi:hypothetical protein EDD18DRAFT_1356450 [Armillaria luteobubalina]|uniref:Heterokaryon incompatibility domain-containing protein n=1 Tax=Armillaria luteobubalina TaxID=153913 RepID=A0AA39UQY1_9AGAR|nr:hypothetical protein EDD18DRAFT_1356450 [Armillaria luteobubalina]
MYFQDEFTLSAFTETGQVELSIEVPKQRSYTGRCRVIPCSLADTPCATLGTQGVLDRLNATLGTSYTLPTPPSSSDQLSLLSILEDFIQRKDDFGTAYALLRPVWNTVKPRKIQDELRRRERRDRELRQEALVGNRIVDPELPPRCVWDLCSNRVTPINGKEWPVPIPKDADLNLIRIEMLNLAAEIADKYGTLVNWGKYAAEYAWLDVLCLRQKGGLREDLRTEEWRLDVPTIGAVYHNEGVLVYLNGLGRPLLLKDGDLDSDRSWFRRAWTLQEVGSSHIIAGDTPDGPMHARRIDSSNYKTALLTRFHEELNSMESMEDDLFATMTHMQKRVSTNPVDRVAGLAFLLLPQTIPAYHESETLEDAWTALVNAMSPLIRGDLLFVCPGVGLGCKKWRPTWDQLMKEPLPQSGYSGYANITRNDEMDEDSYSGFCIPKGHVQVFDMGSAENQHRCGELVVTAADGIAHTFKIRITHRLPIPEDMYTLLNSGDEYLTNQWAIGRQLPNQRFEKVSVIDIVDPGMNGDGPTSLAERCYFILI